MIATCEAFALAERLGLSDKTLFDVAFVSSGQSWALPDIVRRRRFADRAGEPRLSGGLHDGANAKDMRLGRGKPRRRSNSATRSPRSPQIFIAVRRSGRGDRALSPAFSHYREAEPERADGKGAKARKDCSVVRGKCHNPENHRTCRLRDATLLGFRTPLSETLIVRRTARCRWAHLHLPVYCHGS